MYMVKGAEKLMTLSPAFEPKARAVVAWLFGRGWNLNIKWCLRSIEENMALYHQGYAALNSKHLTGDAMDIIDRRVAYGGLSDHPYYRDVQSAAHRYGLRWGGDFSGRWDPTHVEML